MAQAKLKGGPSMFMQKGELLEPLARVDEIVDLSLAGFRNRTASELSTARNAISR